MILRAPASNTGPSVVPALGFFRDLGGVAVVAALWGSGTPRRAGALHLVAARRSRLLVEPVG